MHRRMAVVKLKAPVATGSTANCANAEQRAGVDLVVVVDTSETAWGNKHTLVTSTLHYLLTQLCPNDRVAIVSFASVARPLCGLARMTMQVREALIWAVRYGEFQRNGTADIWAGLRKAFAILAARTMRNPVSSVLLLTDSQDYMALQRVHDNMEGMLPEGCSVNTFGYGADHDAQLCANIATIGNGRYTFIQESQDIGPAVSVVLGGLLSVLAQSVEVQVLPAPGVTVVAVRTKYRQKQTPEGVWRVFIPEISEGERRDVCIEMVFPKQLDEVVAHARVKYTDPTTGRVRTDLVALRVPRSSEESDMSASELIDLQFMRLDVVHVLEFVTSLPSLSAKAALQHMIDDVQTLATPGSALADSLLYDLTACRDGWAKNELAFALSAVQQQWQQRSTSQNSPSSDLYTTPAVASLVGNCTECVASASASASAAPAAMSVAGTRVKYTDPTSGQFMRLDVVHVLELVADLASDSAKETLQRMIDEVQTLVDYGSMQFVSHLFHLMACHDTWAANYQALVHSVAQQQWQQRPISHNLP
eukprot:m51a1_g13042 hypothetical protein (534) ;mRNA; f:38-2489